MASEFWPYKQPSVRTPRTPPVRTPSVRTPRPEPGSPMWVADSQPNPVPLVKEPASLYSLEIQRTQNCELIPHVFAVGGI